MERQHPEPTQGQSAKSRRRRTRKTLLGQGRRSGGKKVQNVREEVCYTAPPHHDDVSRYKNKRKEDSEDKGGESKATPRREKEKREKKTDVNE